MTPKQGRLIAALTALLTGTSAPLFAQAASAGGSTLRDCYDLARARSEALAIRREDIEQSRARARSALGGALPRLQWEYTDTFQDPGGVTALENQGFAGFVQKEQVESKFSLTQPIFSGLKEWSALYGLRRETARDALLLQNEAGRLFDTTAAAFYGVLSLETEKNNTEAALKLDEDRVRELSGFLKLGKARDSEVFAAKARAAALRGALPRLSAAIAAAREDLSRLTGRDFSSAPLLDQLPSPPVFGPLEEALVQAGARSDLRAQREDVAAKEWRVRYEKGSYWPSLDLTGSYYTKRPTFLDAISWDVRLSAKVPLFQGGSVSANVRAAESARRQARFRLEEMERAVQSAVRDIHADFTAAVEEARSLEDAAAAAQSGYDALMKEYALGLVTNLEVIAAQDLLQIQTSARDAARFRAKRLFVQLNVAVERMP